MTDHQDPTSSKSSTSPQSVMEQLRTEFIACWQDVQLPQIDNFLDRVGASSREQLRVSLLKVGQDQLAKQWGARETHNAASTTDGAPDVAERTFESTMNLSLDTVDFGDADSAAPLSLPSGPRFRILQEHAKGGLGQVSLARDVELDRDVALKEIQEQFADDPNSRRRFVTEAKVTGQLEHPGIVPVYGFGVDASGRPYYAMRFIKGDSLKDAIDRFHGSESGPKYDSLEFRQLLNRFVDLCNAVHYAHSRNILHRDIKPANVMLGDFGETLLVDWGLAKVTRTNPDDQAADEATSGSVGDPQQTGAGSRVGTPAYMSPEQAGGRSREIRQASDIYSLGATLYHLLTGQPSIQGKGIDECLARVQRGEVATPREVQSRIAKPLAAICQKAMSLRPQDRHDSAAGMAEDIECWLADEPVHCHRESLAAKLWRWTRKHRTQVTSAAIVVLISTLSLTVLLGVVASFNGQLRDTNGRLDEANAQLKTQYRELQQAYDDVATAEDQARRERDVAVAINEFVREDLLGQASPDAETDRDIKLRTVLDRAAPTIAGRFRDQPLVEAAIRHTIGDTYGELGEFTAAGENLERARDLRGEHLGWEHDTTLVSLHSLGALYMDQGRLKEAESILLNNLALRRRDLGEDHANTVRSKARLGNLYRIQARFEEAESHLRQAWETAQRVHGESHRETVAIAGVMATLYMDQGRYPEAESMMLQTLAAREQLYGQLHPSTQATINNLAALYERQGRYEDAIPLFLQGIEIKNKTLGPTHPDTLAAENNLGALYISMSRYKEAADILARTLDAAQSEYGDEFDLTIGCLSNLADAYHYMGRYEEAIRLTNRAVVASRSLFGPNHPTTIKSLNNLATLFVSAGRSSEALVVLEELLEQSKDRLGAEHPETLVRMANLARTYEIEGRVAESEQLLRAALEVSRRVHGGGHPTTIGILNNLANLLMAAGNYDAAEPLMSEALEGAVAQLGNEHRTVQIVRASLAHLHEQQGDYDKAVELNELAHDIMRRQSGDENPTTLALANNLARAYFKSERYEDAETMFQSTWEARSRLLGQAHPDTMLSMRNLGMVYVQMAKLSEARQLFTEALELYRAENGKLHSETLIVAFALAEIYMAEEKFEPGERLLLEVWQDLQDGRGQLGDEVHKSLDEAMSKLIQLYEAWGKPIEAARWRGEMSQLKRELGIVERPEAGVRPPAPNVDLMDR